MQRPITNHEKIITNGIWIRDRVGLCAGQYNSAAGEGAMNQNKQTKPIEAHFLEWWHNEGSGLPPFEYEDAEKHVQRVSRIAWLAGAQKAIELLNTTKPNER